MASAMPIPTPFKVSMSDDLLSFITQRVKTARIPTDLTLPPGEEWSHGVPSSVMSSLQQYWANKYDWRAVEARINAHLRMFTLPISEAGENLILHFVHHRSSHSGAIPLLFQHGWPGNFLEVEKIIDSLTSPPPGHQAYHVVAPSLPGFVFSSGPQGRDFGLVDMAAVNHKLMLALGYDTYMAQGGDWGSVIVRIMGARFPESCIAVHCNMLAAVPPSWWRQPLSLLWFVGWAIAQDKTKGGSTLGRMMWWQKDESGYVEIQGTKPQTLSHSLMDSPMGMLAWIRDKVHHLVDDDFVIEDEEIITWAMLYLIPNSSGSAAIYKNAKGKMSERLTPYLTIPLPKNVDFGVSIFPKEVMMIPRFWADACVSKNIVFWKEHPKGGHFASVEKPVELMEDIREFTGAVNKDRMALLVRSGKPQA